MIGVDEALERVLGAAAAPEPLPAEQIRLEDAAGRILRETAYADRDVPPFTRSAMDGYAVRSEDVDRVPVTLDVIEHVAAGRRPRRRVGRGQASKIMTGAPIPEGADAVQMVETTRPVGEQRVVIEERVLAGKHVREAGEETKKGAVLVERGTRLGAAEIALLAGAGYAKVLVAKRPRTVIFPTGDELVPVEARPSGARIRESNGHALEVLVCLAGGVADRHPIVADRADDLEKAIGAALGRADVILLSGGVSMGDYDLVGHALRALGCEPLFERVAIKPGKPLWFGKGPPPGGTLIFGLPGNPVSTVVDFLVFARPALRRLMGAAAVHDPLVTARLAEAVNHRPGRRTYLPASLDLGGGEAVARPIRSMGSADMVALSRANALAIIPEDQERLEAGVRVKALPLVGLTR
ncbi:MAG: gephyrin-like molybdotransferase Glp [Acidobacteriota bacterium]